MKKGLLILENPKYPSDATLYDTTTHEDVMDVITLEYSKIDKTWTNPGKPAFSLTNTGNNFVFFDHHKNEDIVLDYDQAQALRALLKMADKDGEKFHYFERK